MWRFVFKNIQLTVLFVKKILLNNDHIIAGDRIKTFQFFIRNTVSVTEKHIAENNSDPKFNSFREKTILKA